MCEHDDFDLMQKTAEAAQLSRRQFGAMGLGAGVVSLVPGVTGAAEALPVMEMEVEIKTPDGVCDAYLVHPAKGKHPAVLVWPDIFGLRTAFRAMGKRLAESGYVVLVVNPFYRKSKAPTSQAANFSDPATRDRLMGLMASLTPDVQLIDAKAFVEWLDKQPVVDTKKKMGTTGYCMGGPITMRTAALLPNRIGAAGSFHGANLANDKPDSPHLLVPKMKAQYLIAIAENDDKSDPKAKDLLRAAFDAAKLPAEIEVYAGAMHGWCAIDSQVYNPPQAEKAWARMLELFKKALV